MPVELAGTVRKNQSGCKVVSGCTSGEPSIQYGAKSTMCWHHARCRAAWLSGVLAKMSPCDPRACRGPASLDAVCSAVRTARRSTTPAMTMSRMTRRPSWWPARPVPQRVVAAIGGSSVVVVVHVVARVGLSGISWIASKPSPTTARGRRTGPRAAGRARRNSRPRTPSARPGLRRSPPTWPRPASARATSAERANAGLIRPRTSGQLAAIASKFTPA